jgi:CRISPR/Cas system-associated exonuclease Cas4 (RecB family)
MTDTFTYDDTLHAYYLDGVRIPSVTQVLKAQGMIDTTWLTEHGRTRGSHVHTATEMYDKGILDEDTLDPQLRPYLEGWKLFVEENEPIWDTLEVPGYHPLYRYGLTPDRTAYLCAHSVTELELIDIKTGQPMPYIEVQMAAYFYALKANGHDVEHARVVYLSNDGKYKPVKVKDLRRSFAIFQAAIACFNWRMNNKLLTWEDIDSD